MGTDILGAFTSACPCAGTGEGCPEYSQALEEEVRELKTRCRRLEEQLEEALKSSGPTAASPAPVPALPVSADNAYLQNHIRCLNETIGEGIRADILYVNTCNAGNMMVLKCQKKRVCLSRQSED